jgi:bifunctional non-homologous end joining protein LigD
MLATLTTKVPGGDSWLHEIKFDGYRTQAHRRDGKISMFPRRGYNWTDRFGLVADELERLKADSFIWMARLSPPAPAVWPTSRPCSRTFGVIARPAGTLCLRSGYLDGFDLRRAHLIERKLGSFKGRHSSVNSEAFERAVTTLGLTQGVQSVPEQTAAVQF